MINIQTLLGHVLTLGGSIGISSSSTTGSGSSVSNSSASGNLRPWRQPKQLLHDQPL